MATLVFLLEVVDGQLDQGAGSVISEIGFYDSTGRMKEA